jgi:hypothetical protein
MVVDVVTWKLITPKKEFDFVCASAEEKDDWFRCIRYTMEGTIPPVFVDVRHAVSLCYIAVLIDDDMCTFLSLLSVECVGGLVASCIVASRRVGQVPRAPCSHRGSC